MKDSDYPALWRASNAAAISCQWWFMLWLRMHLAFLALIGLVSALTPASQSGDFAISSAIATLMLFALLTGLGMKFARLDDAWFRARALAENAKGAAWRFMTKPSPADAAQDEREERLYLEELNQIRERFPQVERHMSAHDQPGPELTAKMREVRRQSWSERLNFYRQYRLQDQIEWYRKKAKANARAESRWLIVILAGEGMALGGAISRMIWCYGYNPAGAIAALVACFIAWTQTKRFSDLSNSYGVAARDLNGLNTKAEHIHDEEGFQAYVDEVENAVSREHRLWVDRRI